MKKNISILLSLFILITAKTAAMQISWDTLIANQSIVLKNRFHQHGWSSTFLEESALLKKLTEKKHLPIKEVIDIVENSINTYNKNGGKHFSDPKCTGFNFESSLLYTIFYPYTDVRIFLFKQDPKRFDNILDKDEKPRN